MKDKTDCRGALLSKPCSTASRVCYMAHLALEVKRGVPQGTSKFGQ